MITIVDRLGNRSLKAASASAIACATETAVHLERPPARPVYVCARQFLYYHSIH